MGLEETMRVVATAAVNGTGFKPEDVPEIQDKPIFGQTGNVTSFALPLYEALSAAGADDEKSGRIVTIMTMADTTAEDTKKKKRVIGWMKKEIVDLPDAEKIPELTAGEIEFLISYLLVARSITAKADETHEPPKRNVRKVDFDQPGDSSSASVEGKGKGRQKGSRKDSDNDDHEPVAAPPVYCSQPLHGRTAGGWPQLCEDLEAVFSLLESVDPTTKAQGESDLAAMNQRILNERDSLGLSGQVLARDYIASRLAGEHISRPTWFRRTFH